MKDLNAWLIVLAGVLLGLHALDVVSVVSGYGIWALTIVVLLIGILKLVKK